MKKDELIKEAQDFLIHSADNLIGPEVALSKQIEGTNIFDPPILGFGDSEDTYFHLYQDPNIIGPDFLLPTQWLPQAQTVISFFLPYSKEVREGNRIDPSVPSHGWLHGRIEGQHMVEQLCIHLQNKISEAGYDSVIPTLDSRFQIFKNPPASSLLYSSNWSERHAAFVCGLGTFGLSKGLITKKGMAGRFGSLITTMHFPHDSRQYHNIYEYCSMCGACAKRCPAHAISLEHGKNHTLCSDFSNQTLAIYKPRYGCGKCQVAVPCEASIPKIKALQ